MTTPYNPSAFVPASAPKVDPLQTAVCTLEIHIQHLDARDRGFATDLCRAFRRYNNLSEKQAFWVKKLLERALANLEPHPAPTPAPAPVVVQRPAPAAAEQLATGFTQIVQLFSKARAQGLRRPKIRLQTASGQKVVLTSLGSQSRNPGHIAVTDAGTSFDSRKYFGRVEPQGQFFPAGANTPEVTQLLRDLAADPVKMAKLYGYKTSTCCFCGLGLKTSESVTVGYGPICADKYGLPWGDRVESTYTQMTCESTDTEE